MEIYSLYFVDNFQVILLLISQKTNHYVPVQVRCVLHHLNHF